MLQLFLFILSGASIGLLSGLVFGDFPNIFADGSIGVACGAALWFFVGVIVRMRNEARLDRYFWEADGE